MCVGDGWTDREWCGETLQIIITILDIARILFSAPLEINKVKSVMNRSNVTMM